MPDFFLISGLFLALVINRDWRTYLDRKVVHFAWFYVLWLTIQFAFKAPGIAAEQGWNGAIEAYLIAFIEPFGTLWFIYLLPVFFVVTKLVKDVPAWIVWTVAAALQIAPIETGWTVVDESASRFVFFYSGYVLAPLVFRVADAALRHGWAAVAYLAVWAVANGLLVFNGVHTLREGELVFLPFADFPGINLMLGFLGAGAVVVLSTLLSKANVMAAVRYLGEHSIVVYLAFFLPMATARTVLLKLGMIPDLGTISLIVTAAGVTFPVILYWLVRGTRFRFLFERPEWAKLRGVGPARGPAARTARSPGRASAVKSESMTPSR
jgi:uncharacterized membrane protein YcfT